MGAGSPPTQSDCAPVMLPAFTLTTVMLTVLFAEIALVQMAAPLPEAKLVMVIVVLPPEV